MKKALLVGLVVCAGLLGAAWLAVPTVIERAAPERIRAKAAARGVELEWETLRWLNDRRAFRLTGVRARHARGSATVDMLEVAVDLRARAPRKVHARGVEGVVDLTAWTRTGGGVGGGGRAIRVEVDDARLEVRRGGRSLGTVHVQRATGMGAQLERADVTIRAPGLPPVRARVVEGTGGAFHLLARGGGDGSGGAFDPQPPGGALFTTRVGPLGEVRIEAAKVWRDGRVEAGPVDVGDIRVDHARYADGVVELQAKRFGGTVDVALAVGGSARISATDLDLARLPLPPRFAVTGRVDLELSGALAGHDAAMARAEVTLRDVTVDSKAIADAPLSGIAARFAANLEWRDGRLAIDGGQLDFGPTRTRFEAWLDDPFDDPSVHVRTATDPVACQAALRALPSALLGPYDRAEAKGTMAPTVRFDWAIHRPAELTLKIRKLETACTITALNARETAWPEVDVRGRDDVDWLTRPFSMRVREGTTRDVHVGPASGRFVPLRQLPRYLGPAMFLSEEIAFYRDGGINRGLIQRALRMNLEGGRFVYGGSTVTQQLVKNLFLTRKKTLARKFQEALISQRIAAAVGKNRVLELYVNCIEFGPNVYGVGPASWFYFQKDARSLTPKEAVFLAMIKPAPGRGAGMRHRGHTPQRGTWWPSRAAELFRRLVEHGHISQAQSDAEIPHHVLRWEDRVYVP